MSKERWNVTPLKVAKTHYIREWAELRGLSQTKLANLIGVEPSTVKRWFDGSIPTKANHLAVLCQILAVECVSDLFRSPDDDWISRFLQQSNEDEKQRAKALLTAAFPEKKLKA